MKHDALFLVLVLAACSNEPTTYECATPDDEGAPADVTITAVDAPIVAAGGDAPFSAWTFDGDVPGPVLRMHPGQSARIKLVNESSRPTTLHFMGMRYDVSEDGTADYPESVANPGCAHVYPITADQPGVWPFLNHIDPRLTLSRGEYGAIVVPAVDEKPADHEFVIFEGQLGFDGAAQFYMTFNGRAYDGGDVIELEGDQYVRHTGEPTAHVGDLVRFRIINVSPDVVHTFGIHGHEFCDRGGLPDPTTGCPNGGVITNIAQVSPLTATTFEFVESAPGRWMFHCHIIDHADEGMMGYYDSLP